MINYGVDGEHSEFTTDLTTGISIVKKLIGSSHQGWDNGSSLIFGKWLDHRLSRDTFSSYNMNLYLPIKIRLE